MNINFRNKALLVLFLAAVIILVSGTALAIGIKKINKEEILEIRLFENPSTGYSWQLDSAANKSLQLLKEQYNSLADKSVKSENEQSQSKKDGTQILVGQGGIRSWIFRGLKEGYQLLTFELKRSDGKAAKTVEYLIIIND